VGILPACRGSCAVLSAQALKPIPPESSHGKCLHCKKLLVPDHRNRGRQKYCSAPACQQASKQASQQRWTRKPENRDYFRGPEKSCQSDRIGRAARGIRVVGEDPGNCVRAKVIIIELVPKVGLFEFWSAARRRRGGGLHGIHATALRNSGIYGWRRHLFCLCHRLRILRVRYAASRSGTDFFLVFLILANIHRLCVNTPHANASSRCSNPLARIGRPRKLSFRRPIRPSV
jgi:hypothetical protein